jgi:hypothetical protein
MASVGSIALFLEGTLRVLELPSCERTSRSAWIRGLLTIRVRREAHRFGRSKAAAMVPGVRSHDWGGSSRRRRFAFCQHFPHLLAVAYLALEQVGVAQQ